MGKKREMDESTPPRRNSSAGVYQRDVQHANHASVKAETTKAASKRRGSLDSGFSKALRRNSKDPNTETERNNSKAEKKEEKKSRFGMLGRVVGRMGRRGSHDSEAAADVKSPGSGAHSKGDRAKDDEDDEAEETAAPLDQMTLDERATLVETSFELVEDVEAFVKGLYLKLFEMHPVLQPYFSGVPLEKLSSALSGALFLTVQSVKDEEGTLKAALLSLGNRHSSYGAIPEFYLWLGNALMLCLYEKCTVLLADHPDPPDIHRLMYAWDVTFTNTVNIMLRGQGVTEGVDSVIEETLRGLLDENHPPPSAKGSVKSKAMSKSKRGSRRKPSEETLGDAPVSLDEMVDMRQNSYAGSQISESSKKSVFKRAMSTNRSKKRRSKREQKEQEEMEEMMNMEERAQLVEASFEIVTAKCSNFVELLYGNLFILHPSLKPYFGSIPVEKLATALSGALNLTVQNVRNESFLQEALLSLGARHSTYGAIPEFYQWLGEALLFTIEEQLEDQSSDKLLDAWNLTYTKVANIMLKGQGYPDGIAPLAMPNSHNLSDDDSTSTRHHEESNYSRSSSKDRARKDGPQSTHRKAGSISGSKGPGRSKSGAKSRLGGPTSSHGSGLGKDSSVAGGGGRPGARTAAPPRSTKVSRMWKKVSKQVGRWTEYLTGWWIIKQLFWILPMWILIVGSWSVFAYMVVYFDPDSVGGRVCGAVEEIGIFTAFVVFLREGPDRKRQFLYQAWSAIDASAGVRMSYARFLAMQDLNNNKLPLEGLSCPGAHLNKIKLPNAKMNMANLEGASLTQADFEESDLKKCNFKSADLADVTLTGAQLDFCDFTDANLCNADLSGSSMLCVNLTGANLSGANLENVVLSGARVEGARFFNASLLGASIGGVNTASATMTGALMPDGEVFGTVKPTKPVKQRRLSSLLSMRPVRMPSKEKTSKSSDVENDNNDSYDDDIASGAPSSGGRLDV